MDKNILILIGSPKVKSSNSDSIGNNLMNIFARKGLCCSTLSLNKELYEENKLMEHINKSDIIILISPVYENSVPGMVLKFFETAFSNKENLILKTRKMFVITNSGFPEIEASKSAIKTCKLFARDMDFAWMGGISVSPGTLIDGKELEKAGKTYKKLIQTLNIISESIYNDDEISQKTFKLMSKSLMPPFIYRLGGRIAQNGTIKNIGKDKFFSKPLES